MRATDFMVYAYNRKWLAFFVCAGTQVQTDGPLLLRNIRRMEVNSFRGWIPFRLRTHNSKALCILLMNSFPDSMSQSHFSVAGT